VVVVVGPSVVVVVASVVLVVVVLVTTVGGIRTGGSVVAVVVVAVVGGRVVDVGRGRGGAVVDDPVMRSPTTGSAGSASGVAGSGSTVTPRTVGSLEGGMVGLVVRTGVPSLSRNAKARRPTPSAIETNPSCRRRPGAERAALAKCAPVTA
jgi:hypothetical protein